MSILVLMRHGESEWNKLNRFTGWVDIPLSEKGIQEAYDAGKLIKDIPFDVLYTSTLIRAQMTLMLAMLNHSSGKIPAIIHRGEEKLEDWAKIYGGHSANYVIPTYCAWELNERMYGELQGLNKAETAEKFGADQVKIWRRSFDVPPPNGESLEMTAQRTIPYFEEEIVPHLREGRNVLVSAHGNSLRSILMDLDGLSKEEVVSLEIATGLPIIYEFKHGILTETKEIGDMRFIAMGIGLNVNMSQETITALSLPATSLLIEMGCEQNIEALSILLTEQFTENLALYLDKGFAPFLERFSKKISLNEAVNFHDNQKILHGKIVSINFDGSMDLMTEEGVRKTYHYGEIT